MVSRRVAVIVGVVALVAVLLVAIGRYRALLRDLVGENGRS